MPMTATQVQQLYVAYFNRPADYLGQEYWKSQDATAAGKAFAASAEYASTYAGMDVGARINAVYQNLFGHAADLPGLTYWSNLLQGGKLTIADVVVAVAGGAQGTDKAAYDAKVSAAASFTSALNTTALVTGYSGTAANDAAKAWLAGINSAAQATAATATAALSATVSSVTAVGSSVAGSNYSLTVSGTTGNFDNITGTSGNDTITAGPGTAETGDVINGGAGTDTLNVRITANGVSPNPQLTSVEKVYARLDATNAASTLNLGGNVGVSEVWADRLEDTDGTGNGTTLTVTGISKAVTLGVTGDSAAGTSGSRGNVTFTLNDVTGSADSANLVFNGGGKVNTTTIASVETLNISSLGSVSNSSASIVAAAATTVKVSGSTQLSLGSSSGATAATLDIDEANSYTVDASGMSGTFRVVLEDQSAGKTTTYIGGSGADRVFLGAGLDTLDNIDGGAGTDSIGFTQSADLTAATGALLKNFEVFDAAKAVAGANFDMDLITGGGTASTIQNVSVTADLAGAATVSNLVDTGAVTISAALTSALTIAQKGAADAGSNADTLRFNISPSSTTGDITIASLVAADIETVTISSNVNPGYSAGHTITASTFAAADTVVLTGAEQLTFTTVGALAATLIDASSMTDKFIMTNASNAATVLLIKGGSADDTLKIGTAQSTLSVVQGNGGADTIDVAAGAGNTDATIIKLAAQSDSTASAYDKVSNWADTEEKLDVSAFAFSAGSQAVINQTANVTISGAGAAATFTVATSAVSTFFNNGANRAVSYADNGTDTFVFVDVNKDGAWSASSDSVVLLVGLTGATWSAADFVFA